MKALHILWWEFIHRMDWYQGAPIDRLDVLTGLYIILVAIWIVFEVAFGFEIYSQRKEK